jgi:peptide/nickel transport system ATP-binding protein
VVEVMADEVVVMQGGVVVEQGPAQTLLSAPTHPYTRALLSAVPRLSSGS